MKYLYPVSLMLLLLASCGKDETKVIDREKTDWAFYKLSGNVKTISEKSYETTDGKTKGKPKHEILSEHDRDLVFNDEGMLVAEKTFDNDGKLFEDIKYKGREHKVSHVQYTSGTPSIKTDYTWDEKEKNNLSITRRSADNSPYDKVVMKYKNNKLIEHVTYNAQDQQSSRLTYRYDKAGNMVGEANFGNSEVVQYKTEYKYNNNNQKVSETHYDKDGKIDYQSIYQYESELLISTETSNAKGEVTYVEKNGYDGKGNLTSHYIFDKFDAIPMRDEYTYDAQGNRTQWNVYKNEELSLKAAYNYDKHGNLTKVLAADGEGNVIESKSYTYEYDKKGNWIKKTYLNQNQPSIITERKITYFPEE